MHEVVFTRSVRRIAIPDGLVQSGSSVAEFESMKKLLLAGMVIFSLSACTKKDEGLQIPTGSDVTVERRDGVKVEGKLIEVQPDRVVVQLRDGVKRDVARADIATVRAATEPARDGTADGVATTGSTPANVTPRGPNAEARASNGSPAPAADPEPRAPAFKEVTIPAGTVLKATLNTAVASDTSSPEDQVRATLQTPVTIAGVRALPAGSVLTGHVTDVARAGKVKGRARIAFRFSRIDPPGDTASMQVRTSSVAREAAATKKRDAATIGGGAVGGAIIGGILGGGDGAAKGAAIGGAGGTGVVLATRGKEVRLAAGAPVSVKLSAPLTVHVPVR
jgi:hypothetical protein